MLRSVRTLIVLPGLFCLALAGASAAQTETPVIGAETPSDGVSADAAPKEPVIGAEIDADGPTDPPEPKVADADKPKTELPEVSEPTAGGSADGAGEIKDDKLPSEASIEERLSIAQAEIKDLQARVADNSTAIAELRMLLEEDREAEPRPAEGAPPIRVTCADDPECAACVAAVAADLETHLVVYERLRAIYSRYTTFQKRVIIIGDMLAGFHSVSQNAWGGEKLKMQEELAGLQRAYDAKLNELVGHLQGLLDRVEACHPPDGAPEDLEFNRRLFVSFMLNAYRRND
ncbi:MAG: hypothetical protein AAGK37_10235 [Pseudomonadota bacterium]